MWGMHPPHFQCSNLVSKRQGRSGGRGAKGTIAPPPEIFSVTISLQTKILTL